MTKMITYNRLTIDNYTVIKERAKLKNDGIFTFRGITYRVENHKVTHFAYLGKIERNLGFAVTEVGTYQTKKELIDKLKSIAIY